MEEELSWLVCRDSVLEAVFEGFVNADAAEDLDFELKLKLLLGILWDKTGGNS